MSVINNCNSFGFLFPELAKKWHPTKNNGKTPFDYAPSSNKKVWWKCNKSKCGKHEWKSSLKNRTGKGSNCPICSNITSTPSFIKLSQTI